jgi:hypothetical protein
MSVVASKDLSLLNVAFVFAKLSALLSAPIAHF